ncbi:hypothetical protein EMIT0P253_10276 [Pseudomonas sp. IT-P253]
MRFLRIGKAQLLERTEPICITIEGINQTHPKILNG